MTRHRPLATLCLVAACTSAPAAAPTPGETTATTTMTTTDQPDEFPMTVRLTYGDAPEQFGDLSLPSAERAPVVVLIHGGFWRNPFELDLMEPLATDLVQHGFAVWNIEYRRIGDPGGGWPGTFDDVAVAVDHLALVTNDHPIDLDRVAFVGHSAGGHLALWAAGRADLPDDAPGAEPLVTPVIAIGQGAVVDMAGAAAPLGNGAAIELLDGTPDQYPDRYDWATPRLGAGPRVVTVVGTADDIVPPAFSADPAQPGAIDVIEVLGADHFDLIDPEHEAWTAVIERLETLADQPTPPAAP